MATAEERHADEVLMQDPDYAAVWQAVRQELAAIDLDNPGPAEDRVKAALDKLYKFLDTRPNLTAIIEAVEATQQ